MLVAIDVAVTFVSKFNDVFLSSVPNVNLLEFPFYQTV
jgi:hypothetical protein